MKFSSSVAPLKNELSSFERTKESQSTSASQRSMTIETKQSYEEEDLTESILGSMMLSVPGERGDDSVSDFGDSVSKLGASLINFMEGAVTSIKDSVKGEIVRIPTAQEAFIEKEKTRTIRLILDDPAEFRKFKAEMNASGRICNSRSLLDQKIACKLVKLSDRSL